MKKATGYVKDLQDWLKIRNYSKATISAYGCAVFAAVQFAQEEARAYILNIAMKKGLLITKSFNCFGMDHLPRRKSAALSQVEVQRLIESASTLKHQVFMVLLYSTGPCESLALELGHIDGQLQIRVSKVKEPKIVMWASLKCFWSI